MDRITFVTVMCWMQNVLSFPIDNGLTLKFFPILSKEEMKQKEFGALFAKIPQDTDHGKEMLSQLRFPHKSNLGLGCTNQIVRVILPENNTSVAVNESDATNNGNMNLPLIKQPNSEYKVLLVSAPPGFKLSRGDDEKPFVIYIMFADDKINDTNYVDIPTVYFVRECDKGKGYRKKEENDPILIVDSNRTVTGLSSKEVSKLIKFRNKLIRKLN